MIVQCIQSVDGMEYDCRDGVQYFTEGKEYEVISPELGGSVEVMDDENSRHIIGDSLTDIWFIQHFRVVK